MPLNLFPYQEEGARFLASRRRAALLDKPGVGKTAQAIRALDLLGASRGIIVCPAAVRENWRGEFAKFAYQSRAICKGTSIHDFVAWKNGLFDTLVTSYEMAAKWAPHIHEACEPLEFVIFDEAHYLKNDATARTKALLGEHSDGAGGLLQWAQHAWWLTGTPVPNDPIDIYTFLRFAQAMPLRKTEFSRRYFTSRARAFGTAQRAKVEMLPELRALIANNSLCRTMEETGVQLPPIFLTTSEVDGDTKPVRDLLLQHPGLDQMIRDALMDNRGLSNLDAPHVATLRRLIGEAKALPYAATLLGEIEGGLDKMVVFAHHRQALYTVRDYLWKHGIRAGCIMGETPEKERVAVMAAFQGEADYKVMLCNIRAAGTGLTLTASCHLDMLESDWAPASNYQAIKRVHRLTQTRRVRARLITLANSFDVEVNRIVAEKTAAVGALDTGGTPDLAAMLGWGGRDDRGADDRAESPIADRGTP